MYDEGSGVHTPGDAQSSLSVNGSGSKKSSPLSPQGLYSGMQRLPSDLKSDSGEDEDELVSGELREIVGYGEDDCFDTDENEDIKVESPMYTGAMSTFLNGSFDSMD